MKTKILLSSFLLCFGLFSHGQWTYDSLSLPRVWMGAVTFGTKAYFAGGQTNFGDASIIDIYDVSTKTWDTPASLSVARTTLAAVACDSLLFFAGGCNTSTWAAYSTVDIWDMRNQQWSIGELSIPRFALSAVSKGNIVLFAGGLINDLTSYTRVDIYDTQTGFWWEEDLTVARGAMASAVVGDKAIFAGGLRQGGDVTARVDIYNFTTGTWSIATLSQARSHAVAITVGNKVIIAGGMTAGLSSPSDVVDIFDADSNTWKTSNLSVARMVWDCGAATINGKAYFAGGGTFSYGAVLSDFSYVIDIYDPESGTWSVDYLIQPRACHSVLGISLPEGDYLLAAGGKTDGELNVKSVEIFFDPAGAISKPEKEIFFRVYPNPSAGNIHLEILKENHQKPLLTNIYNMRGQLVFTLLVRPGDLELNLNVPDGVYLLKVISDYATYTKLITIQN